MNDAKIKALAEKMNIKAKKIPLSQFKAGIKIEMEHKDVTGGNLLKTAKIAMAHLNENRKYYSALKRMEKSFEKGKKSTKNNKKAASKGISKRKKG